MKDVVVLSRPSRAFAALAALAAALSLILFVLHSMLYLLLFALALLFALGALLTGPFRGRRLGVAFIVLGVLLIAAFASLPALLVLAGALILGGLYQLTRPSFV